MTVEGRSPTDGKVGWFMKRLPDWSPGAWIGRLPWLMIPPRCRRCGGMLDAWHAGVEAHMEGTSNPGSGFPFLCDECWRDLPWATGEGGFPPEGRSSPELRPPPEGIARVWAPCRYEAPVGDWVRSFKYEGRDALARLLGTLLLQTGAGDAGIADGEGINDGPKVANGSMVPNGPEDAPAIDWVVPVPLHPTRLRKRGFNQSLILAHHWLQGTRQRFRRRMKRAEKASASGTKGDSSRRKGNVPLLVGGALRRVRPTLPQVNLTGSERAANVDDAFALSRGTSHPAGHPMGRHVLLVDDVLTSGATLRACARVLHEAGAARVSALVVCRVGGGADGGADGSEDDWAAPGQKG